ncbi:MAG: hypothetical protein LBT07_01585 [Endomicrobium sp.]|jgi:hypothetical protein|nr:hypothetical protein [Endomicrobium sp.]
MINDYNNNQKNGDQKPELFKWYGYGTSPIGLAIFVVGCSFVVLLLALAGRMYLKF